MKYEIEKIDRDQWQKIAHLFHDYNYHQIWDFGINCAKRLGAISEHVVFKDGLKIAGLADVRIKKIPIFNTGIAYINGAPLVRLGDGEEKDRLKYFLEALKKEFVEHRGMILRISAPLGPTDWNESQTEVFLSSGFSITQRGLKYRTLVLDLSPSLEEIRKNLNPKWRNKLNGAEKNRLSIHSGTGMDLFEEFGRMYTELLDRKNFNVDLDVGFYIQIQNQLTNGDLFQVSIAEQEGQAVAGNVSSMLGDTCIYLLGASNQEGLKTKASYLLQWNAIQMAREKGCRWYDLCGIDPDNNPGVYDFKKGMGGADMTAPGPFEIYPKGFKSYFVLGCEKVYRYMKRGKQSY